MRLIDADVLKKELYQQWFTDILLVSGNSDVMLYELAQKIDKQPIVYDVDYKLAQAYNQGLKDAMAIFEREMK